MCAYDEAGLYPCLRSAIRRTSWQTALESRSKGGGSADLPGIATSHTTTLWDKSKVVLARFFEASYPERVWSTLEIRFPSTEPGAFGLQRRHSRRP